MKHPVPHGPVSKKEGGAQETGVSFLRVMWNSQRCLVRSAVPRPPSKTSRFIRGEPPPLSWGWLVPSGSSATTDGQNMEETPTSSTTRPNERLGWPPVSGARIPTLGNRAKWMVQETRPSLAT